MGAGSVIGCSGLKTSPNQLAVARGALVEAEHVVIHSLDVAEPRRGQRRLSYGFGSAVDRANELAFFEGSAVVHYGADSLTRDTGSAFSDYSGSYAPPDAALLRMKFMEMMENLYFTSNAGVKVLEAIDGTPGNAWVPKALGFGEDNTKISGNPDATGSWMPPDCQVGYRYTIAIKDSHGRWLESSPSPRIVVKNPADVTVATGGAVRSSNVVTVTKDGHQFVPGIVVTIDDNGGDANFPEGQNHTITANPASNQFRYSQTAGDTTSGADIVFTSGQKYVALAGHIPDGLTTSHYIRIYRTLNSNDQDTDPSDDLYLAKEYQLAALDISNGTFFLTDKTPEGFLQTGTPLYTSENIGDGPESANERPPLCKDICEWKGMAWCFNVTGPHRFTVSLLGVGTPDGVQVGDTITIAGVTYTAQSVVGVDTDFPIYSTLPTASLNIEQTARALVRTINFSASNTDVYAYYISNPDEPPGQILIEERGLGGDAFEVYASRVASWSPALTTSSTGAQTSENSREPSGWAWSKKGIPEAVPLGNYDRAGAKQKQVLRGVPLKDAIYVFKEDGNWKITGDGPFYVNRIDTTARLLAPDTVKEHNNRLYALTTQGIVAFSEVGVEVVGFDIDRDIRDLFGDTLEAVKRYSFGVSYETDRQYHCFLPLDDDDTAAEEGAIYESGTDAWTTWPMSRTCGAVHPTDDVLYYGDGESNTLRVERKTYTRADYADEEVAVTIVSSSGKAVTLASASGIQKGDMLFQSEAVKSLVVSVSGNVVTVLSTENWAAGAATVLIAYACKVKWAPNVAGAPEVKKTFYGFHFHFRRVIANFLKACFDSDTTPTEKAFDMESPGGFGTLVWGQAFGNVTGRKNRRAQVPIDHVNATAIRPGIIIREARASWELEGYTPDLGEGGGKRGTK